MQRQWEVSDFGFMKLGCHSQAGARTLSTDALIEPVFRLSVYLSLTSYRLLRERQIMAKRKEYFLPHFINL